MANPFVATLRAVAGSTAAEEVFGFKVVAQDVVKDVIKEEVAKAGLRGVLRSNFAEEHATAVADAIIEVDPTDLIVKLAPKLLAKLGPKRGTAPQQLEGPVMEEVPPMWDADP